MTSLDVHHRGGTYRRVSDNLEPLALRVVFRDQYSNTYRIIDIVIK